MAFAALHPNGGCSASFQSTEAAPHCGRTGHVLIIFGPFFIKDLRVLSAVMSPAGFAAERAGLTVGWPGNTPTGQGHKAQCEHGF